MDGRRKNSEEEESRGETMKIIGKQNNERSLMNFVRAIFGVSSEVVMDKPNHEEVFCALSEANRLQMSKAKEVKSEENHNSEAEVDEGKKMLSKGALRRQMRSVFREVSSKICWCS
uniref:Uncharacterized protein n=1 Tax=Glossina pallidipes TaxID=7398 RepID=A0A1A9Z7S2_GLOPL